MKKIEVKSEFSIKDLENIDEEIDQEFHILINSDISKRKTTLRPCLIRLYESFRDNSEDFISVGTFLRGDKKGVLPPDYEIYERLMRKAETYSWRINNWYLDDYYSIYSLNKEPQIIFKVDRKPLTIAKYQNKEGVEYRLKVKYKEIDYLDIFYKVIKLEPQKETGISESDKVLLGKNEYNERKFFLRSDFSPKPKIVSNEKTLIKSIWPLKLAEQVLEINNKALDHFRRSGPLAEDIKSGLVIKSPEYDRLIKGLEDNDVVLLSGPKASGKTVLTRILAYNCMMSHPVAFLEINNAMMDTARVIEQSQSFGRESNNALLIVEDAHLQPELVNELLFERETINCKIIITLRDPFPTLHRNKRNFFENLTVVQIDPFNVQNEIISSFFKLKNWDLNYEVQENLLSLSKGNLWVLRYALKSLLKSKDDKIDIDKNLIIKQVREDLDDLASINTLYPRLLITLSVLYRFEIPTDIRFLYQIFIGYTKKVIEETVRDLCNMREIIEFPHRRNYLYGLPHSVLADFYFTFRDDPKWEEDTIYGDELDFIVHYIESPKTLNALSILPYFKQIGSDHELTLRKLFKKINIKKFASKINIAEEIISNIKVICSFIGNSYFFPEKESSYLHAEKNLLKNIDKKILAHRLLDSDDIDLVGSCLLKFSQTEAKIGTELWGHINKILLGERILNLDELKDVRLFLEDILGANPEFVKDLFTHINPKTFADKIVNSNELYSAGSCIKYIYQANTEIGTKLWGYIKKELLCKKLSRFDDIDIGDFFRFIFETNPIFMKDLSKHIEIKILAEHINTWILEDEFPHPDALDVVGLCIKYLYKADISSGEKLWRNINKDLLLDKILSFSDPSIILLFLKEIFETNPEFVKDISNHHVLIEVLSDRIVDPDDLDESAMDIMNKINIFIKQT